MQSGFTLQSRTDLKINGSWRMWILFVQLDGHRGLIFVMRLCEVFGELIQWDFFVWNLIIICNALKTQEKLEPNTHKKLQTNFRNLSKTERATPMALINYNDIVIPSQKLI